MKKIIEVKNFIKRYGNVRAVNDISFYVEEGMLFSFLGPNGAGKSTTIDTLCTLLDYNRGSITIDGCDLRKDSESIRRKIGVVFQESLLDDLLTVRENLLIRAGLYIKNKSAIRWKVNQIIELLEIDELVSRPYGKLSGGQRRRTDIAVALLHTPKILFLDEPTTGLDPQTRLVIWEILKKLQQSGMTIFLTTHYMEEAAESDYIIVIDRGKIAAKGTPAELRTQFASDKLCITPNDEEQLLSQLAAMGTEYTCVGSEVMISLPNTLASLSILENCKQYVASFRVIQGSMDDAFIGITGRGIR
ncbi:MAG: ATP-binding cassette domain-containing protein [Firmicutes bacterium]|nr:ATP-binding cassette domain-containing protein [Bacillota bacterium]